MTHNALLHVSVKSEDRIVVVCSLDGTHAAQIRSLRGRDYDRIALYK